MVKHRAPRRIGPQARAAIGTGVGVLVFGALTLSASAKPTLGEFRPIPPTAVGSTGQTSHPPVGASGGRIDPGTAPVTPAELEIRRSRPGLVPSAPGRDLPSPAVKPKTTTTAPKARPAAPTPASPAPAVAPAEDECEDE